MSLESVHDTTSKHVISQREAYSRCELDLTNHTTPELAGTAVIVVAVKRFPIRKKKKKRFGRLRLFQVVHMDCPPSRHKLCCRVINRKFISRYISGALFPLKD